MPPTWLVIIELVLVFGGLIAFAVWQLWSTRRDAERAGDGQASALVARYGRKQAPPES